MTIKEIAQQCGVSRGTVDRVLNHRGRVKPETKELVLRTLEGLNYQKNMAGRALTVKRTAPKIGVLLCSEGNPFFEPVLQGVQKALEELKDYGVSLNLKTMHGHSVEAQMKLLEEMTEGLSALVIQPIFDVRVEKKLKALLKKRIPVVTVNTDVRKDCRTKYVGSDYYAGGATAAGLMNLVLAGHGKVGILTGVPSLLGHTLRLKGFLEHLSDQIHVLQSLPALDEPTLAYQNALQMVQFQPDLGAVFVVAACVSDVCRALLDAKREDIAVVAFDDVPSTREMMRRGMVRAVVCQQPFEQGYRAFRAAFDMILAENNAPGDDLFMENQIKILENLHG